MTDLYNMQCNGVDDPLKHAPLPRVTMPTSVVLGKIVWVSVGSTDALGLRPLESVRGWRANITYALAHVLTAPRFWGWGMPDLLQTRSSHT